MYFGGKQIFHYKEKLCLVLGITIYERYYVIRECPKEGCKYGEGPGGATVSMHEHSFL